MTLTERQVTPKVLSALLNEEGIACTADDDGDVYVTGFPSPYWITIDAERKFLRFYTFVQPLSSNEADLMELVNRCNDRIELIRFAYSSEHVRFFGTYQIPFNSGILRAHILHIARDFADHFNFVLAHEDPNNLLTNGADQERTYGRPKLH